MICTHCGNDSVAPLRSQSWLGLRGSVHHSAAEVARLRR
jgi:hypothetical protein